MCIQKICFGHLRVLRFKPERSGNFARGALFSRSSEEFERNRAQLSCYHANLAGTAVQTSVRWIFLLPLLEATVCWVSSSQGPSTVLLMPLISSGKKWMLSGHFAPIFFFTSYYSDICEPPTLRSSESYKSRSTYNTHQNHVESWVEQIVSPILCLMKSVWGGT